MVTSQSAEDSRIYHMCLFRAKNVLKKHYSWKTSIISSPQRLSWSKIRVWGRCGLKTFCLFFKLMFSFLRRSLKVFRAQRGKHQRIHSAVYRFSHTLRPQNIKNHKILCPNRGFACAPNHFILKKPAVHSYKKRCVKFFFHIYIASMILSKLEIDFFIINDKKKAKNRRK